MARGHIPIPNDMSGKGLPWTPTARLCATGWVGLGGARGQIYPGHRDAAQQHRPGKDPIQGAKGVHCGAFRFSHLVPSRVLVRSDRCGGGYLACVIAVNVGVADRRDDRLLTTSGPMWVLLVSQRVPAHAQFVV